jgi:hypothetical protein
MLGDLVVEGKWKITSMRVLEDKAVEVSFQESGKIYGVEYSGLATVVTRARPDGTVYGGGQALLTTKEGESFSWNGIGLGQPKGGMAISYRGCKIFEASASSQKLAKINKVTVVFEADADENGDGWHKHWEWK